MRVIGMLSGTSHDAVDAALAELRCQDGEIVLRPGGLLSVPFPERLRTELADSLPPAATTLKRICRLDTRLGQFFGEVAGRAHAELARGQAELVVSHGQTCYHWVEGARAYGTLQLGGAAWIAEATGLPVVSDLRTRDITRGGQGAPLAATLDALLLPRHGRHGALNLGGIANITARDRQGGITAYDLGPAGALIDVAANWATGGAQRMDTDGLRAARGTVDRALLLRLLDEPYYRLPPPKSTGKELFHAGYLRERLRGSGPDPDDLVATVTELTACLVAAACREHALADVTVSGGGVRNPVLMERIRALSAPTRISDSTGSTVCGLPAQAKEAYLFALLGFLTVHGIPGSVPSATGAHAPALLGSITPGAGPLRLPPPVTEPPLRLRIEPVDRTGG
ncbi:anhydro-N-acetylmuramic acid kinase [Streptomyces gobiensis]|uniref:anhydro-N-acetylmuramic acid kinase n=1 Tax=Streptomyces gobiensis TaxID=2875706 RepID=UPI001E5AFF6E|nr:anhydro-N-acetylmuramic acid kinase [Streptomyces gobiensis]UGY94556.1 anhydro-N-acetylmuramic acid kinase [Streptomyces gobiensis]